MIRLRRLDIRRLYVRRFDRYGFRALVDELRPKFLVLRVRARGLDLRWAVPSWAVEELLCFGVRVALLHTRIIPLPLSRRRMLVLVEVLCSAGRRDLLALPAGVPLVAIETADVSIEIERVALGARA